MIFDQRHLAGGWTPTTPEEVTKTWELIARLGFNPMQPGLLWEPRELTQTRQTVAAYISDNRWVADCPACRSGIVCWPENPKACCFGCFRVYKVKFPTERTMAQAIELLDARPPANRHWNPAAEKVKDLAAENAEHAEEIELHARMTAAMPDGALEVLHAKG